MLSENNRFNSVQGTNENERCLFFMVNVILDGCFTLWVTRCYDCTVSGEWLNLILENCHYDS